MSLWDDLAALAVPLIWILILAGRFMKNRIKKRDYYAAEDNKAGPPRPGNEPIHPKGTNWK